MARGKTFRYQGSQGPRLPEERLPQETQFPDGEVAVRQLGSGLITPVRAQSAAILFDLLTQVEGPIERPDTQAQERDPL